MTGADRALISSLEGLEDLECIGATQLRDWVHGLGVDTFVGTSQRVFPKEMKAAPLLRAWLHRLRAQGIRFTLCINRFARRRLRHLRIGVLRADRRGRRAQRLVV